MKQKREWLVKLRKAKGFKTQRSLSAKLNISHNYLSEIESGRLPSGRIAHLISEELGFDIGLFFGTGLHGLKNKTA